MGLIQYVNGMGSRKVSKEKGKVNITLGLKNGAEILGRIRPGATERPKRGLKEVIE